MEKFDELKYWLDLNDYIKTSLALSGLSIAMISLFSFLKYPSMKILSLVILFLIILVTIMQLILGIRQIGIDGKARKDYKIKYQKQLDNLKKTK